MFPMMSGLVLGLAVAGCSSPSPLVVKVDVFLASGSNVIAPGASVQLNASAHFSRAGTEDVTSRAQWRSENEGVATVAGGRVTAVGEGATSIVATFEGIRGMMSIQVRSNP